MSALGRGFGDLIPTYDPTAQQDKSLSKMLEIKISHIIPDAPQV